MATVPPIRQTIKFEGLEEIKKKLSELGGAGEKAFEDLRAASAPAVQSMERLEGAIANVQRSMASVAVTGRNFGTSIREAGVAFNGFEQALSRTVRSVRNYGAVLAAAVAGVALFVRSGIQAGDDIEEQAQALGLSTQAYQELGFAALEAGVKQGQFANGIKIFSQQIQKASADAAKAMLAFVEGVDKNFDTLGGRVSRVTDAAVVPFSAIREAARNLQADLASQGISRPLFAIEEGFRKLAAGGAEGRAEFERLGRVSLPAARDGLDVLRDGSEKSIKALNKLLPTFKKAEDGSIDLADAFLKTADHFKALPDGVQKTAQAMAFFGRSAGPQLVPFLNQGSAGIGEFLAKTRELGLQLTGPQIEASSKAARSFDLLARSATNVKNQIGAAFAPVASTIAGGFTDFLSKNQIAINAFANDLNTKATPYVQAFFDMLAGGKHHEGENVTEAGEKIDQIRQRFVTFGESVKRVGKIIGDVFTVILAVLDKVAFAFNAVFSTSLSGVELGVILVITKMVGGFTLLFATLKLAGAAFTALNAGLKVAVASGGLVVHALRAVGLAIAAVLVGPAAIAAAFAIATVAIIANWDDVKRVLKSIGIDVDALAEHIKTAFGIDLVALLNIPQVQATIETTKKEWAALTAFLGTDINKFIETTKREWTALTSFLGTDIKAFVETTKKEFAALIAVFDFIQSTFNKRASRRVATSSFDEVGMAAFVKEIEAANQKLASAGPVAQAATQQITAAVTAATATTERLGQAGLKAGTTIVTTFDAAGRAIRNIVPIASPAAEALAKTGNAAVTTFDAAGKAIRNIVPAVGGAVDAANQAKAAYDHLADAFGSPKIAEAAAGYRILKGGIIEVSEASKQGVAGVGAWKNVLAVVGPTLAEIDAAQKKASASTLPLQERLKATGQAFTEMKATSTAAFTEMKAGSKAAFSEAEAGAEKLERAMGGISALGPATSAPLETIAKNIGFVDQAIDGIGAGGVNPFAQIKFGAEGLVLPIQNAGIAATTLGTNLTQAGQAGAGAFQGIAGMLQTLPTTIEGFLATLSRIPQSLTSGTEASTQFANALTQAMNGAKSPVDQLAAAVDALMAKFEAAIAKAKELASARSAGGGSGFDESGFEGFKGGGHFRGRGTGTSDSNLAWISDYEYIQPAKVVRQPGVLSFMEMLRRSGGDLQSVMERFRGFSMGGLADGLNRSLSSLMIPRFATGGLADMAPAPVAAGGRSLTLVLDGQRFAGLRGPDDTIARLEKHAIAQQAGSTGRKPSWVR